MRLTKSDREQLRRVLYDIERAQKFLLSPRVIVATKSNMNDPYTLTRPETRFAGEVVAEAVQASPINKEIGSDLAGLHQGINDLSQFLATH